MLFRPMTLHLECTPDETIAMFLGKTRKQIVHHNDKGRVCNFLANSTGCLALIDEDPGAAQPKYLTHFLKPEKPEQFGIKLLWDEKRGNQAIVICPRLEDWLIYTCELSGVDISDFGFSSKPSQFHREINSRLSRLKDLLYHLDGIGAKPLKYLKSMLN